MKVNDSVRLGEIKLGLARLGSFLLGLVSLGLVRLKTPYQNNLNLVFIMTDFV